MNSAENNAASMHHSRAILRAIRSGRDRPSWSPHRGWASSQDPISKLNPEMLYRYIQYLVEESDWMSQGEELIAWGGEG